MQLSLDQIAQKLDSENVKERKLALVALRDVAAEQAVPLIKKVIHDPDQQVRSMAVYALGVKPMDECLDLLVSILVNEADYGVRADAAGALGNLEDRRAFEPLVRAFNEDGDWLVRFSAAVALGNLRDPRAQETLLSALQSKEVVIQQAAIAALGEIGAIGAVDQILNFVQSEDWLMRQRLATALGCLATAKSRSALRYLAKDNNNNVAEAARRSLAQLDQSNTFDQPSP
ncbi:HEAT repeat domain-containing protein [filamentous cyanobacterium LEGE 11480]|uniref:HEAT repeat domain-containing protein n=1 Tax=Romeriopsis navalis LEGE 11480 TaxID=2777977 RepID=A0A928VQA5_9CYAN|nr:HEAT repeat domain-containing protein [Romeriopsis navalis]MBE9032535.1 HEAT repeat domain-containing protein [Romeriopsis navalis LEGE 11480]